MSDNRAVMMIKMLAMKGRGWKWGRMNFCATGLQDFALCSKQTWLSVPSGTLWYVMGLVKPNVDCLREFCLSFHKQLTQRSNSGTVFHLRVLPLPSISTSEGMNGVLGDTDTSHVLVWSHYLCLEEKYIINNVFSVIPIKHKNVW